MPLWKTILSYDGTPFCGWQIQPGLPTVQGTLSQAIYRITGKSVLPQGSGRTDAGVHALAQVASFALDAPIPPANFHRALNRALPQSMRVLSIEHAPPNFHARHSVLRKTYEYRIYPTGSICPPMLAPYVWACPFALDLARLQESAIAILGTHDFTSFSASDPDLTTRTLLIEKAQIGNSELEFSDLASKNTVSPATRTIYQSAWHEENGLLIYRVTGSGFLHHMVRNLVGTFVEAGCGRIPADSVPAILNARNRSAAGPTAPARGLFLMAVEY